MTTVTGLFDNYDDASNAVRELQASGIPESDISVVASNSDNRHGDGESNAAEGAAGGAGLGAAIGGAGGLLTGLGLVAIPGLGPVVAAGWLAATAVGAVGGAAVGGAAGGIVGALTDSGIPEDDAHVYAEGVRRGGTLVTAKVDDQLAPQAERILQQASSVDLEGRRGEYQTAGWTRFDADAEAYSNADIGRDEARDINRV